jgi:hypothetical protein
MLENDVAAAMSFSLPDPPARDAPGAQRLLSANAIHRSTPQP